jgi:putative phage-type endonuclease
MKTKIKPESDPEVRKWTIGGSYAGAINGTNPWMFGTDVYDLVLGLKEPKNLSDNPAVQAGVMFEAGVGKLFTEKTGIKIRMVSRTMNSKEWPIAQAHIDAKVVGEKVGVEIKTTAAWNASHWGPEMTRDIPPNYLDQINHYLYVTGWDYWWCVVLIGGQKIQVYKIERDEKQIRELIDKEKDFWNNHILKETPPEPMSAEEAMLQFPKASEELEEMKATPLLLNLISAGQAIRKKEAEIKAQKSDNNKDIMNHMKSVAVIVDDDGEKLVTWINGSKKGLDQKAFKLAHPDLVEKFCRVSEFRTFKIIERRV